MSTDKYISGAKVSDADPLPVSDAYGSAAAIDLAAADVALAVPCRAIYVGVAGDVKVDLADSGTGVVFKAAAVGILRVRAVKVYKVGTSATNLLALT